jgi:sterol desaturase/sphingolipid hydroxylase (fatty acid hydroxylase superfamily)
MNRSFVASFLAAFHATPPATVVVAITYVVGFFLVVSEVVWISRTKAARRSILRSFATSSTMMIGALIFGQVSGPIFRNVTAVLSATSIDSVEQYWIHHRVYAMIAAFVTWDALGWFYHWIGHHTRIGWAGHRPHHTGTQYDLTLGLRQSWLPLHAFACYPLIGIAGFEAQTVLMCAAVSNLWQLIEHTSVDIHWPDWFRAMVMTPGSHRQHHGHRAGQFQQLVNLGPVFTIWDRLAGTWLPEIERPVEYGVELGRSSGAIGIELAGWKELLSGENRR